MKVAVTGASGFVGRAVCSALYAAGHEPVPVDSRRTAPGAMLEGVTAIVHLAAIAHRHAQADEVRRGNVDLTREVGRGAAAGGIPMVFMSSVKVHGERSSHPFTEQAAIAPADIYAESKVRAEEALRAIPGLTLTVLRPPLVYGAGVKANFLALMNAIARGMPLPLGSIRNRRSLIYVDNLADAVLRRIGEPGTFLVCDGPALSTPDLCRRLGGALGRPARLLPFPPSLLPAKLSASLEVDDRAIRSHGWAPPFAVEEGLRWTAQWYRDR
jgi:nucleoside-diphosphate-sugar epimerase